MVSKKTALAGVHVLGNPLFQLLNPSLIQHYPALDRINFADKEFIRSRVL
jgi:hypothetical protein